MFQGANVDVVAVLQALTALHMAMTAADIEGIADLLDDDYVLVHITGYVQRSAEWLEVIETRQFSYHAITVDTSTLTVTIRGQQADVAGRGVFDATINGTRAPWPLQFAMSLHKVAGRWQFVHSRYVSF